MNSIVPQAWIIQEKIRQEKERRRKENEDNSLPISLPQISEEDEEYLDLEKSKKETPQNGTVIIIDL